MNISETNVTRMISANTMIIDAGAKNIHINREMSAIILKWEGETEYLQKNNTIISNGHRPMFIPKGASYEWKCTKKGRVTIVEFDTDYKSEEIFVFPEANSDKLKSLMKKISSAEVQSNPLRHMIECKIIYEMLITLLSTDNRHKAYTPAKKIAKIQPAVDYLSEHYYEDISNDFLAGLTSVSTVYFRKIFTSAFGISPIHYLHEVRIKKAKEMLESDYGTLADVAVSVGYPNVFHFSKMFKKITGIPPGTYARQQK